MIKLVLLDIDGVLTDGKVLVDEQGIESKRFCFKDFDAFGEMHERGWLVGAITRENNPILNYLKNKVVWDFFYSGEKNKAERLKRICKSEGFSYDEVCYVGDAKYDLPILQKVGLPLCPLDAIDEVKCIVKTVLSRKGGDGCVWEMVEVVEKYNKANKG